MPYQLHINKQHRLCYMVLYGVMDGDQLIKALTEVMNHQDWRSGFDTLWDGTAVEEVKFDFHKAWRVRNIAQAYAKQLGPGKSAYVATRPLAYATARMMKVGLHIKGREIRVFRSLEDARNWLGLALPSVWDLPDDVSGAVTSGIS
jgi:hypothetical protein